MSELAVSGLGRGEAAAAARPRALGQEDFLLLLTTQLRNQDPLSPMDNTAFVAQLAQFAAVSGITETNAGIGRLAALLAAEGRHAAPAWLGRVVTGPDGKAARVERVAIGADGALLLELEGGGRLPLAEVSRVA
ncbi:flagellar hook assembly protein FlgD [Thermaurantiacus sp.]